MEQYVFTHGFQKPKSKRIQRVLKERDPKIIENPKTSIALFGTKTSQIIKTVLSDIHSLRKPYSIKFVKHNDIRPFEDAKSIEFFAQKNDASLFVYGNHTKKRPHNLILGRLFNYEILDMVEFGIENYKSLQESGVHVNQQGSKPCFLFIGDLFVNSEKMRLIQNLLLDIFRGEVVSRINLTGLDHVYVVTCISEQKLHFGHYSIQLKNSGTKVPKVELINIGPTMDLIIRRTKFADDDFRKKAEMVPQQLRKGKDRNKNLFFDEVGTLGGRLHIEQENIEKIAGRRYKAMEPQSKEEIEKMLDQAKAEELLQKRKRKEMEEMKEKLEPKEDDQPTKKRKFGKRRLSRYKRRKK